MNKSRVIYNPSTCTINDIITSSGKGFYTRRSSSEILHTHPGTCIVSLIEARHHQAKHLVDDPRKISESQFYKTMEMFDIKDHIFQGFTETFKTPNFFLSNICVIYTKIYCKTFSFRGLHTLSHSDIVQQVIEKFKGEF